MRRSVQGFLRQQGQHAQRIVVALTPGLQIQRSEHFPRLPVPAPPQIVGKPFEPADSLR